MGYYKDTTKTKQINKIMAEITLGLVIEKAKSPQNSGSENEGISHEKIEEYHFDILKKQVEVLHSLCKGEDEVETEVGKKIVNDVLCAKFGKKCIQDAFKNGIIIEFYCLNYTCCIFLTILYYYLLISGEKKSVNEIITSSISE